MNKVLLITLLTLAVSNNTSFAQKTTDKPVVVISDKSGWHKIGKTTVNFKTEKEQVLIIGSNRFSAIKFKVQEAPIDLISIEAYFASGDKQDIGINMPISAPGESKIIELNGGMRTLKKIVFVYKTLPNHKDEKGHVEIWGLKVNEDSK
jgi:hypothetical protein